MKKNCRQDKGKTEMLLEGGVVLKNVEPEVQGEYWEKKDNEPVLQQERKKKKGRKSGVITHECETCGEVYEWCWTINTWVWGAHRVDGPGFQGRVASNLDHRFHRKRRE